MLSVARYDYHVHESHSRDAPGASISRIIESAEKSGVEEICFTSHLIIEGPDKSLGLQVDELENYVEQIKNAQENTDIVLKIGYEVDYFPAREKEIERILEEYKVDFVLGSTHYINGIDIGSRKGAEIFFKNRLLEEAVDEYYSVWTQAINSGLFDVMAHPDYWKKYIPKSRRSNIGWKAYGTEILNAIQALSDNNVGFEVNTSAKKIGWKSFYPIREFSRKANISGVKKVTIGSDSHSPDSLGYKLTEAVEQLKDEGFTKISIFTDRKSKQIPIEKVLKKYKTEYIYFNDNFDYRN
jgi:histidinol-phosphatase (PHP family)